MPRRRLLPLLAAGLTFSAAVAAQPASPAGTPEIWRFDRLENIGGHKTGVLGEPAVIDSPLGKAVLFEASTTRYSRPSSAGRAETFTWKEAISRPRGTDQQRWFHFATDFRDRSRH